MDLELVMGRYIQGRAGGAGWSWNRRKCHINIWNITFIVDLTFEALTRELGEILSDDKAIPKNKGVKKEKNYNTKTSENN